MSNSAPSNTGVVRMEVRIFPELVPLRKRIRQQYSFQFNSFTLGQVTSNDLHNLETVMDNNENSIGITFKKLGGIYHTVLGFPLSSGTGGSASASLETSVQFAPTKPIEYDVSFTGDYYLDDNGSRLYNDFSLSAMKEHQTFVIDGSLFSHGFRTIEDVVGKVGQLSDDNSEKFKAYAALVPTAETVRLAETISFSKGLAADSIGASRLSNLSVNDSDLFVPGGWNPNDEYLLQFIPDGDAYKKRGSVLSEQQYVGYIGIRNVYPGSIVELLRQAEIDPFSENENNFAQEGISFKSESKFSDKASSYRGLPPGVHATFKKVTPLFPGEDFTIRFRKLSVEHPIATVEDESTGELRWLMLDQYSHIDAGLNDNPNSSAFTGNNFLRRNNAVCPFYYEQIENSYQNTQYIDVKKAKNYYLADQPYVVIDIDGGPDNKFYLIIPNNGEVVLVEVTNDICIFDAPNSLGELTTHIEGFFHNKYVSRVIHGFGISGSSLLSQESWAVHVQHYRGSLQITFEPSNETHNIIRKNYGKNLPSIFKLGIGVSGEVGENQDIKDKIKGEFAPTKLGGSLKVHMGHVKMAFNFSPISYASSATLKIENPVGITNLDGNKEMVNILLRTAGGYEESENKKFKVLSAMIKNESDEDVPGQSDPFFTQQAGEFVEIINGKNSSTAIESLPFSFRQLTTGPNSIDVYPIIYGRVSSKSKISCNYTLKEPNEFVNRIFPSVTLRSGDFTFYSAKSKATWTLKGAMRPVCDGFSVFVPEGAETAWTPVSADVTLNVMDFSDNWSRSDKNFVEHSGSIKFYLNKGDALPILESLNAVQTEKGKLFGGVRAASKFDTTGSIDYGYARGDMSAFLASLQDKYFYIQVRAWRDVAKTKTHNVGLVNSFSELPSSPNVFYGTHKNKYPDADNTIIFTGICSKSSFNIMDSHIEMSCNLNDYWMIFDQMKWLNAPFYDCMRDYNAVMDIIQKAGFFYENGKNSPGYLINKYVTTPSSNEYYSIPYDGYTVLANDYVLPGSYNSLNQPMFKPKADESYSEILKRITQISGKVIYFDRKGVLHYDIVEDDLEHQQVEGASPNKPLYQATPYDIFSYTYSKIDQKNVPWWNVIIGDYNFERVVNDIVNEIRVVSSTPNSTLVAAAHMNRASLSDIDLPGFIGFRKMFLQKSGYFGSGEAVRKQVQRYSMMFNAPLKVSFSVLGRVGLQANQTIKVDGPGASGPYRLLLTNVSNKIDPGNNSWLASLEGRYFLPGEKIKFSNTTLSIGTGTGGGE